MIALAAAAFFLLVLPASCLGWGLCFRRMTQMPRGKISTTITLGVASVIFVGGCLNRLELAYAPTVLAVIVAGLCMLFFSRGNILRGITVECKSFGAGAVLLAILFIALLVLTQLPPSEYNPADDLRKYFTWPTRMLATGTMVFSSTSAIGAESLGGQAFLHGVTLTLLPANYLVGLDGIFGVILCLLLALSLSRNPVAQTLSVFAIVVIHPQFVNISTLYIGVALIIASIEITSEPSEQAPPAHGMIYAALIACKPTFVIFIALHFVTSAFAHTSFWKAARCMLRTGAWTLCFVSPWILLHCRHWLDGIGHKAPAVAAPYQDPKIKLFSFEPLFYGGNLFAYSTIVFGVAIIALIVFCITRKRGDAELGKLIAPVIILPVGYLLVFFIFGPMLTGQALIIRYYTPMVIGLVVVLVGLTLSRLQNQRYWLTGVTIALGLILSLFAPSFADRAVQLITQHNQLSYYHAGSSGYYRAFNANVFLGLTRQRLERAQRMIPTGAPFLAWVDTPFQLNFNRNPIYDFEAAGASNPWALFPKVRYILWEKGSLADAERQYVLANSTEYESINDIGYHERQIAARWLDFYRYTERLTKAARLVDQQGTLFLYELTNDAETGREF